MKFLKHFVLIIVCFSFSIFLCMQIFDDILIRFTTSQTAYMVMRIILTIFLYNLILSVINKRISNNQISIMTITYIAFVLCLTFLKGFYGGGQTGVNLNLLELFDDLKKSSNGGILLLGNFVVYIPIGMYIKRISKFRQNSILILSFILYCFLIESIQYVTKMGFFDINDIILNNLGFCVGLLLYMKFTKIHKRIKN